VFELRAGPIQDVLPPSIHPDTKIPYGWIRDPDDGIPELPKEFLLIQSHLPQAQKREVICYFSKDPP
jgi:hypothetical protein